MFRLVLEIAVAFQKYVMRCKFIVVHRKVTVAQDAAARKRVLIDREPEGLWVLKSGQRAPGSNDKVGYRPERQKELGGSRRKLACLSRIGNTKRQRHVAQASGSL